MNPAGIFLVQHRHGEQPPAHDSADRKRAGAVGHEHHRIVQRPFDVVQRLQDLAAARMARNDRGSGAVRPPDKRIVIERMQRQAQLKHDVIRRVDDTINRTQSFIIFILFRVFTSE